MQQTQQFNGIEVKWSGRRGHRGRKFELASKRAIAKMIIEGKITHPEVKQQLQLGIGTSYIWVRDYENGHFDRNRGTGHYGTRRPEQISLVGRLTAQVEHLTDELNVATKKRKLAKDAEEMGATLEFEEE